MQCHKGQDSCAVPHSEATFVNHVSLQAVEAYKGRMGSFGFKRNIYRASRASHIYTQNKEEQIIAVNEGRSLANLHEYLALRFGLKGDFSFVINGISIRKRKERSIFCKEITFPQYIHVE